MVGVKVILLFLVTSNKIEIINKRENTVTLIKYKIQQTSKRARALYTNKEAKSTSYWRYNKFEIIKKSFIG